MRVAFGESDRAVGLCHHCTQHIGVERMRQLPQLVAGASGLLEIPEASMISRWAGKRKARRTRSVVALVSRRMAAHAASVRPWASRSSASPGCGSNPKLTCGPIGVLRFRELAAQPMNLGLLIEPGARWLAIRALGTFARTAGFGQRLRPRPLELHDLGTMDEADSGERDHLRLLLAHGGERGGPFASALQGVHLPAGVDHAAVHPPRHDRRQLTRDDGQHGLVQAFETGHDVAPLDERAALRMTGRRRKVGVSERLSDREGLACGRMRRIGLSLAQLLLGDSNGQVAALDAVVVLDEPLASRRPGVRPAALSA